MAKWNKQVQDQYDCMTGNMKCTDCSNYIEKIEYDPSMGRYFVTDCKLKIDK